MTEDMFSRAARAAMRDLRRRAALARQTRTFNGGIIVLKPWPGNLLGVPKRWIIPDEIDRPPLYPPVSFGKAEVVRYWAEIASMGPQEIMLVEPTDAAVRNFSEPHTPKSGGRHGR